MNTRLKELINTYKDMLITAEEEKLSGDYPNSEKYLSGVIYALENVIQDLEELVS